MTRQRTPSTAASEPSSSMLPEAITRLADELRLLREVIDELREDVSWVTGDYGDRRYPGKPSRRRSKPAEPTGVRKRSGGESRSVGRAKLQ